MSTSYASVQPDDQTSFQCRHIFTNGQRCGSVSLRKQNFCYYHHNSRQPVPIRELEARKARQGTFELFHPEDRSAIQHAIGQVLQRIASNDLDPRRAGLLLYGLQIASLNLMKNKQESPATITVEDIELDPELGPLAPIAEFNPPYSGRSSISLLVERLEREEAQRAEEEQRRQASAPDDTQPANVLPHLQAFAEAFTPTKDVSSRPKSRSLIARRSGETRSSAGTLNPVTYRSTPNVNTVTEFSVSPGFNSVEGNFGWFGESGKCWVSRQNPAWIAYLPPNLPVLVPSRKLPE